MMEVDKLQWNERIAAVLLHGKDITVLCLCVIIESCYNLLHYTSYEEQCVYVATLAVEAC